MLPVLAFALALKPSPYLVVAVRPGSPASGELQPGDVIVELDGQPVGTVGDFGEQVRLQAGAELNLDVLRSGQRVQMAVATTDSGAEPGWLPTGIQISEY